MTTSSFLSEELRARISAWPENALDSREPRGALHSLLSSLYDVSGQDGLFGKTFPGCYQAIADEDSFASCAPSPTAGIHVAGGCWTLNMSEWTGWSGPSRSDDGVCSLSDFLETGDHLRRYCLSPKACAGILRRAARRGKELPPMLLDALLSRAGTEFIESPAGQAALAKFYEMQEAAA